MQQPQSANFAGVTFVPGNNQDLTLTGTDIQVFAPGNQGTITAQATNTATVNLAQTVTGSPESVTAAPTANASVDIFAPGNGGVINADASADSTPMSALQFRIWAPALLPSS